MGISKERVETLRKKQGIRSLDELLGIVQTYQPSLAWSSLSQIINGRRSPRLENAEAIARALNTTVAYLIEEVDDPSPRLDHPLIVREAGAIYEINDGQIRPLLAAWTRLSAPDRDLLIDIAQNIAAVRPKIIGDEKP